MQVDKHETGINNPVIIDFWKTLISTLRAGSNSSMASSSIQLNFASNCGTRTSGYLVLSLCSRAEERKETRVGLVGSECPRPKQAPLPGTSNGAISEGYFSLSSVQCVH